MSTELHPAFDRTGAKTLIERRGNVRHPTHAVFTARLGEVQLMGGGRDVSRSGAFFFTSDEIPLEVSFTINGKETKVPAKIVRIESISPGTFGIAVQFDHRLTEGEMPH